MSRMLCFCDSL